MKKVLFLAHDPGGYDVTKPVVAGLDSLGIEAPYYCVGPAGKLDAQHAIEEDLFWERFQSALSQNELALVVTGTSWGTDLELRVIRMAREAGVRTMSILDYWSNYKFRCVMHDEEIYPDDYIVMDELAREEALVAGVPDDVLVVAGHPGLDKYFDYAQAATVQANAKTYDVLVLSQPLSMLYGSSFGYTEQLVLEHVIQWSQTHPTQGLRIGIKFHPKDRIELREAFASYEVEGDLMQLLPATKIVVGMNSMALLHAVILGTKVVSYQPNLCVEDLCITNKLNLTRCLTSFEQFTDTMNRLVESDATFAAEDQSNVRLQSYIWSDGRSTDRVIQYIREIVGL